MRNSILVIVLMAVSFSLSAHEGGHGTPLKEWNLASKTESVIADYLKSENGKVWLTDKNHTIKVYDISDFSSEDQQYISAKNELIHSLNSQPATELDSHSFSYIKIALLLMGAFLLLFSFFYVLKRKKVVHVSYGAFGALMILFVSCKYNSTTKVTNSVVPANDLSYIQSLFNKFGGVTTSADENYLYISSNGLPDHDMMVGITNWQQQVPINQNYTGTNSWAIPLHPKMAEHPLSTKTNLLKGAIAVAVNGIPIFNPLNNRGEDANAIGELDKWGGHCGRADDYHYHLPPLHLQEQVGAGNPVAYAVDGFPVYGETMDQLDEYLGKLNADGSYQYHTRKEYPYFIAGMRGEVKLDPGTTAPENQVTPQPRTQELRPALRPLRGAEIIDFQKLNSHSYSLIYQLNSEKYIINYHWDSDATYTYEFISPDGKSTSEIYKPRN